MVRSRPGALLAQVRRPGHPAVFRYTRPHAAFYHFRIPAALVTLRSLVGSIWVYLCLAAVISVLGISFPPVVLCHAAPAGLHLGG